MIVRTRRRELMSSRLNSRMTCRRTAEKRRELWGSLRELRSLIDKLSEMPSVQRCKPPWGSVFGFVLVVTVTFSVDSEVGLFYNGIFWSLILVFIWFLILSSSWYSFAYWNYGDLWWWYSFTKPKLLSPSKNQPIKRKKEGEEKRMTQEEMLLEAAQTGIVLNTSLKFAII